MFGCDESDLNTYIKKIQGDSATMSLTLPHLDVWMYHEDRPGLVVVRGEERRPVQIEDLALGDGEADVELVRGVAQVLLFHSVEGKVSVVIGCVTVGGFVDPAPPGQRPDKSFHQCFNVLERDPVFVGEVATFGLPSEPFLPLGLSCLVL